MTDEFQLAPLPPDADTAEMLEAIGPLEERPAESQYCVFRSGRERFCLPVLDRRRPSFAADGKPQPIPREIIRQLSEELRSAGD